MIESNKDNATNKNINVDRKTIKERIWTITTKKKKEKKLHERAPNQLHKALIVK